VDSIKTQSVEQLYWPKVYRLLAYRRRTRMYQLVQIKLILIYREIEGRAAI